MRQYLSTFKHVECRNDKGELLILVAGATVAKNALLKLEQNSSCCKLKKNIFFHKRHEGNATLNQMTSDEDVVQLVYQKLVSTSAHVCPFMSLYCPCSSQ